MSYSILNYNVADRLHIILKDQTVQHFYTILSKHLREDIYELMVKYKLEADYIRKRLFITGDFEDICILFNYAEQLGVKFESITEDYLRVDINEFITKFT